MPNVDIRGKLASMNVKVKSARMPSPHELRESYLNSGFHKSFKQPLAVRTRVEDVDTQKARQLLTEKMTPTQLGNLKHPLDIPLPKMKKPSVKTEEDERYEIFVHIKTKSYFIFLIVSRKKWVTP